MSMGALRWFHKFPTYGASIISFWIFICQLRLNQNQKWNFKKIHTNMNYNMCSNGIVHTSILYIEMKKTTKIASQICYKVWLCQNMSHYHMQVSRLLFKQRLYSVLWLWLHLSTFRLCTPSFDYHQLCSWLIFVG